MRRFTVLALLFLFLSADWVAGAEPDAQQETAPAATREPKPPFPILDKVFRSGLSPEQLAALGGHAAPEKIRDAMTPEQRAAARARLAEAEASATTPEALKEIAKGYLLLDESAPNQGEGAVRVATQLQGMEPESSAGFTLAASGYHQMGDYPAATQWALEALKRDENDKTAQAVLMLSMGRTKRGAGAVVETPRPAQVQDGAVSSVSDFTISERDVSPQALALMKQAVAARRELDMDKSWSFVIAAMRADPKAPGVQEFYRIAQTDRLKHTDTLDFLRQSREAMDAGRGAEAVAWAQKAYERSGDPTVQKIVDLTRQQSDRLAQAVVKRDLESRKPPIKGGLPLWPIGAGLGLAVMGYGVARSKSTLSQEEDVGHNVQIDPEDDARWKRHAKAAAISLGIGVAVVYGGPPAWRAVAPIIATAWRGGGVPAQNISAEVENAAVRTAPRANSAVQALTKAAPQVAQELQAAATSGERVRNLLMPGGQLLGQGGSSSRIRIMQGTAQDAEALFSKLAQGTRIVPHPGRGVLGKLAQLPNGDFIGLRYVSKSGPPTIDVNIPGIAIKEIKFLSP